MDEDDKPQRPINYKKFPSRLRRRGPPSPPSSTRKCAFSRELKKLNIHKPRRAVYATDVQAMRHLKECLRETWKQVWDKVHDFKNYSKKQLEFYRQYAISGRTNKTQAAHRAGYATDNPTKLLEAANRNLRLPHAEDLIRLFELEEKARMGLRVEDVANWFETIAVKAMEAGDFANANRAMENYGKYLGMFVERKEVLHKTVHSKAELDARIAELTAVLREEMPAIESKLSIN
jgi:hypothetical protein